MKLLYTFLFSLCFSFLTAQVGTNDSDDTPHQSTLSSIYPIEYSHSTSDKCLTDYLLEKQRQTVPNFTAKLDQMNTSIRTAQRESGNRELFVIPVVVHVIHQFGAENISDEQIMAGIQHLNEAFSNSGNYHHPDGVNTNIQFCLAAQTPVGDATNGITRTSSALTNLTVETQDLELKNLIRWDPNKYLNIWLVQEITSLSMGPGIAGYAYFPTSQGQAEDGIVNEAAYFGSSFDNSKVHIHEAGHYLSLYHTFEGGCYNHNCEMDGDKVCDTPPDNSTASVPCSATPNTCSTDEDDTSENNPFRPIELGGLGDQADRFKNYMDYGYQACQEYFSYGQAQRMQAAITTQREILLQSNGCDSPCLNNFDLSISADNNVITLGNSIHFTTVTDGATSFEWTINNVVVGNDNTLDYLFTSSGNYIIKLTANNNDPNCIKVASFAVQVLCPAQASFAFTSPLPFNPGDEISAANTSINSTTNQWVLDGNPVSASLNWSQTFNEAGGHSLYLIVGNGECSDTSNTQFFQLGNCDLSGVTNHWVFLNNQIRFINGNAVLTQSSPIQNHNGECSSSIADADGNLLLSSDGVSVWDRNHNLMPNGTGLLGHLSATQSVLITPHPGNANQYFVFTNDAVENYQANGMRYNIVDMTLNNGMGDIIPSFKNRPLLVEGSEKLSATWHANGRDIWVGSGERNSNTWYAFLIDNNGIHTTPVVSNIGTPSQQALGAMRFSNDGNRMAACMVTAWPWRILVCDFNRETGVYSNPIELTLSTQFNQQPFSIAFSPDNSKLYVSLWQGGDILQYDLSLTTAAQIQSSQYAVDPYPSATFGHLVLASNGRIYVKGRPYNQLDEIRTPNAAGALCEYYSNPNSIPLELSSNNSLPNMMQGYFMAHQPSIAGPKNICKGEKSYHYGIAYESQLDSAVWTHTGPGSFISQNGTNTCTLISGTNVGTDTISVTVYGVCGISHDTLIVQTNEPELSYLEDITYTCDSILLTPGSGFLSYEWSDNSYENSLMAYPENTYAVTVKGQSGCIITDSTWVAFYPESPPVDLGPDRTICDGQITVLTTNETYAEYQWQDGSQNSSFTVYQPGTYWVRATDWCGSNVSMDTLEVTLASFEIDLNYFGEKHICSSSLPITLSVPSGFESYFWDDGQIGASIEINSAGTYSVTVLNADGCSAQDTFLVEECSDVERFSESESIQIYPNPADDSFTLVSNFPKEAALKLFSMSGQLIQEIEVIPGLETKVYTQHLSSGLYLLQFRFDSNVRYKKISVVH